MPDNEPLSNPLTSLLTELRRGTLTLAVMGCIRNASEPQYGYALLQTLQSYQMEIEANTLYPLLRRLEAQGLLRSEWDTSESRPRKYYSLSEKGLAALDELTLEWSRLNQTMRAIVGKDGYNGE